MKKLFFLLIIIISFVLTLPLDAQEKYLFTDIINLEHTSVKNQASSGTCWSYSTNSFLESEMIRMGREPIELAQIFSAHCVYMDKAEAYVRMHGSLSWGDGGELPDVIQMYEKYGAMPQAVYTGLHYGTTKNKFAEMQAVLKGMLDAIVANPNGKLSTAWKKTFNNALDNYLGPIPDTFQYEGKRYTPKSFAKEKIGIDPTNYVQFGSVNDKTYYEKTVMLVPDNWSFSNFNNVPMQDLTDIIDNALNKGYTVEWGADVSEKYFSWKNGVAYVPEKDFEDMNDSEKNHMFDGPKAAERVVTSEMRQLAWDNYETTEDHGMHIIGLAKDQNGKSYYKVKNSWGIDPIKNPYAGYIYVSKAYVLYKTTAIMVHKNAVPSTLRKKMDL